VVRQPALPLWRHVVFVDWHGVLSRSPFWGSIVTDPRHPLNRPLRAGLGRLFSDGVAVADWMTGRRSTPDVVAALGVDGAPRYGPDYLCRQLEKDCRAMRVNTGLLRALQPVRERAFVVVATDNVDVFADAYRRVGQRPASADDTLSACATGCDDLVSSSDVGALKVEPEAFFGGYLAACGLGFADAMLVDDRSDNCAAFRAAGGTALRWTMHADPVGTLTGLVHHWLDTVGAVPVG
jgi:hypothetical protein